MLTAIQTADITFNPIVVAGGRKFHGRGYLVYCSDSVAQYGWKTCWTTTARIWVPETKSFVYANADFCDDDETVTPEQRLHDLEAYVMHTIESTREWCKRTKPQADALEIARFARNVLRKQHPEMQAAIDAVIPPPPDTRDLDAEVQSTVEWAKSLKTRPCTIYGHFCPGGKPYPAKKCVDIARKALTKKGLAQRPEFEAAFAAACRKAGLA